MASKTSYTKTTVSRTSARPPYRPEPQPEPSEPGYESTEGEDNRWDDNPTVGDPRPEEAQAIPIKTVGQEQLERSREMQAMGIQNWVDAHDERDPNQQPQAVEGVTPLER
jgi:hypothetical protein